MHPEIGSNSKNNLEKQLTIMVQSGAGRMVSTMLCALRLRPALL
jgi:hypothetical protein